MQQHTPLKAKTWYGMSAHFSDEGKVVVFFQAVTTLSARYATIGFQEAANLDNGSFWPTSFAVTALDDRSTEHLVGLLQQATR